MCNPAYTLKIKQTEKRMLTPVDLHPNITHSTPNNIIIYHKNYNMSCSTYLTSPTVLAFLIKQQRIIGLCFCFNP